MSLDDDLRKAVEEIEDDTDNFVNQEDNIDYSKGIKGGLPRTQEIEVKQVQYPISGKPINLTALCKDNETTRDDSVRNRIISIFAKYGHRRDYAERVYDEKIIGKYGKMLGGDNPEEFFDLIEDCLEKGIDF